MRVTAFKTRLWRVSKPFGGTTIQSFFAEPHKVCRIGRTCICASPLLATAGAGAIAVYAVASAGALLKPRWCLQGATWLDTALQILHDSTASRGRCRNLIRARRSGSSACLKDRVSHLQVGQGSDKCIHCQVGPATLRSFARSLTSDLSKLGGRSA